MGSLASSIGDIISNIFNPLWDFITNLLDWLNPFSENFILSQIIGFLGDLVSYINPASDNFFVYKLIDLLGDLFKWLFVPDDNYFSNIKETILSELETKLPYQDYINMFGTILDISTDGQLEDIKIENYQVGSLKLNVSNFIDFSIITKYRATWYAWVRGFVFIFLIIYHLNQIMKFLRGYNIADGSSPGNGNVMFISQNSSRLGSNNKMLGGGK